MWSGAMSHLATDAFIATLGYGASALVLATFCFSNPTLLRIFALLSNVAFIAFGYIGEIYPIMLLHLVLVPINMFHLAKLLVSELAPQSAAYRLLVRWVCRPCANGKTQDCI
jgi:hypothetical protein